MARKTNPRSTPQRDEHIRAKIEQEGLNWAREASEDNAWDCMVLTLDGGGVRGYASLLILWELMKRIAFWENEICRTPVEPETLLPCHYFDYIWGTSTGGLIAIMLGRLRMSIPQALDIYRGVGEKIFGRKRRRALAGLNILAARYDHKNVEHVVKSTVRKHCKVHSTGTCNEDKMMWPAIAENNKVDTHWHLCQAVCITARVDEKNHQALPLRTYLYEHHHLLRSPDPYNNVQDIDFQIWEVGRATSAAPFYFKHFEKKDGNERMRRYRDGGIIVNNPSSRALNEVRNRYGPMPNGDRKNPALLLSVGTGIRSQSSFANDSGSGRLAIPLKQSIKQKLAVGKHLLMRYTEGESIHNTIREDVQGEHKWYKRLNVDVGLGQMDLGDWRRGNWGEEKQRSGGATLTDMETAVKEYVTRDDLHDTEWYLLPKQLIEHTAERLVRQRAMRARLAQTLDEHRNRWHTYRGKYASGVALPNWSDESCDGPYERQHN